LQELGKIHILMSAMPKIHLTTFIEAPAARVFNLSRSIDLHEKSMAGRNEKAVAGTTTGLIGPDESVTWKARHLGKTRLLKVRVTGMQEPESFTDEMTEGDFRRMKHEHYFMPVTNGTLMIDLFSFESPYGPLGRLLNRVYLKSYMRRLLEKRNQVIKEYAESEKWKFLLHP
jgi:ligand-binding SRPBCC domain-containing protein